MQYRVQFVGMATLQLSSRKATAAETLRITMLQISPIFPVKSFEQPERGFTIFQLNLEHITAS